MSHPLASRLRRHLVATYLTFDPRSLGLFRILLGITLFVDLYQRYVDVDYWYTNDGIVPTSLLKYGRMNYLFSLFLHASNRQEAVLGMALCAVVYALFTIGCLTRLSHLLSLIAVVSLNSRVFFLENGGHFVLNLLCVWSLFLPLGRRFSIDAILMPRLRRRPVVSLAVLALLLQFGVIYLFNVIQKTGPTWKDGSAVHYVLHDERMNTAFAVWMRETLPYPVLKLMSRSTLLLESAAVLLILSPLWPRRCRLVAIALLPALHFGFALCLKLGVFSHAMIAFYALLPAREHWDWLERACRAEDRQPLPACPRSLWQRCLSPVREATVLLILAASAGDLVNSNPAWPESLRYEQPELLKAIVWYPRIRQFWRMFTPQPPLSVVALTVEAHTSDGRIVDPYNEVASRYPKLPPPDGKTPMPVRLGQDQLFTDYTMRVPQKEFAWCLQPLSAWILRYADRTGNPADRIERFSIYRVTGRMPAPGKSVAAPMTRKILLSYP